MKSEVDSDIEVVLKNALKGYRDGIKELQAMILPADYYMDIKSLSRYSGISVRKLKDLIRHPEYPLPSFKIGNSIKIKKSEFETWISRFRIVPETSTKVDDIINDVIKDFQ